MFIQPFMTQCAIEPLDVGILFHLARLNKLQVDAVIPPPLLSFLGFATEVFRVIIRIWLICRGTSSGSGMLRFRPRLGLIRRFRSRSWQMPV